MSRDLVYVAHPEPAVAARLGGGLEAADYEVVSMSNVDQAREITSNRQFHIPDAILTPLGDLQSGDSILIALYQSNPLMEQIPLVVVAANQGEERREALRMGLLSVVLPPYDGEEVALTTKLAIEKHRSDQLLFGSMTQLSVPDLLQTAEAGRRTGTVTFKHAGQKGTVWMSDGYVIGAEIDDGSRGEEAVYSIAVWTDGTFEANFGGIDFEEEFRMLPSALLLEAMRRFDEESASTMPIPTQELIEAEVLDLALVLLNAVSGYALNHLHPRLVRKKIEQVRDALREDHPALAAFVISEEASVIVETSAVMGYEEQEIAPAVGTLVEELFRQLDGALTWRFTRQRLAKILAPWREELREYGFLEPLEVDAGEQDREDESQEADGVAGKPVPVGCMVLEPEGRVESFSSYGPRIGRIDPKVVIGRPLAGILPDGLASLTRRLVQEAGAGDGDGLAVGREVMRAGHQEHVVRVALVRNVSKNGFVVTINRLRDQRRSLTAEIERDPLTGALRDGRADRLLVANEDFLHAFEGLFSKSLRHRHHELLQRFGKKWGLRHAMRLEQMVQRDYGITLREMESQMALELLSASVGIFGLGKFEAELEYRDSGLIVIRHTASPFPGIFSATAGGACSILSGFHAATLSYLAGRHLAAREVRCGREPGQPCVFVVATEDRLTKLLISTPGSVDHELFEEIVHREDGGVDQ